MREGKSGIERGKGRDSEDANVKVKGVFIFTIPYPVIKVCLLVLKLCHSS